MPRGFDFQKGPNQKTFGTIGTISAKINAKGFRPSKRSEPKKTFGIIGTISAKINVKGLRSLLMLLSAPIYVPQAHGSW